MVIHGGHVGLRGLRPHAHAVWMCLSKVLHSDGGTAVGITLAQHRINCGTLHGVVTRANILLFTGAGGVRVVRERVPLALQLGDCGLHLWDRCRDIGKFDDVRLGGLGQLAQLSERVIHTLFFSKIVAELRQDAAREGNITGLNINSGGGCECLNNWF